MTIDTIDNDIAEVEAMRRKLHIHQLKTAAVVLSGLADGFKDVTTKNETKSIAASVIWAVKQLEGAV